MDSQERNITVRSKRLHLVKTLSFESLAIRENSLLESPDPCTAVSMIDLSTHASIDEILSLKKELQERDEELASAHAEIDKLALENTLQRKLIEEMTVSKEQFKKMYIQSLDTPKSIKISTQKRNPRHIFSNKKESKLSMNTKTKTLLDTKHSSPNTSQGEQKTTDDMNINQDELKKIYIFGGQQCTGLASALVRSRISNVYEKYKIESITKPYALSTDILSTCAHMQQKTIKGDKIIISVGENDPNPTKLLYELSSAVKLFEQCSILILSVKKNKHLNEYKLNTALENFCYNIKNCQFIDCSNITRRTLCRLINKTIDTIDYNSKYLKWSIKNNLTRDILIHSTQNRINKLNSHIVLEIQPSTDNKGCPKNIIRKGTIPYYFKIIKKNKAMVQSEEIQDTSNGPFFL